MTINAVRPLCRAATTVKGALEAIAQRNPGLNAFVSQTTPEEASTHGGQYNGPLKGWPVAVKSNIATTSHPTSCASNALRDYVSPYQATAVDALVQAGAVVVGKTNMDEFGMGSKNEFSIYGATRNPCEPVPNAASNSEKKYRHSPGGSSGGSAAAVASGMCRVALGSDTGGSVRLPAAWCGVVGFKPTYGRVSRHGLVAYGSSLDAVGVIARDVDDVHLAFHAISAPDSRDMTCMSKPLRMRIDALTRSRGWTKCLEQRHDTTQSKRPLEGIRIGIPKEFWVDELSQSALESWEAGAQRLANLGCEIVQISLPHIPSSLPAYYTLAFAESSSNLARYDGIRYGTRSSERPVESIGKNASYKYANTRSDGLGNEVQRRVLLGTYVMTASASEQYHVLAQKIRRLIQHDFDSAFALPNALSIVHEADVTGAILSNRPEGVDALLFPTATDSAPLLGREEPNPVTGYVNDVMTVPANLAGIPAISVPSNTMTVIDARNFFQEQRGLGPGSAVQPTASEVKQGFTALTSNPDPLPKLFQPLTIRGLSLKNRTALSPMCMYSSTDGFATDFHLVHIGQFAMRGVGLIIMEATGVLPEGRITPNCLGIWKDEHIEKLAQIVNLVHANKAAIGIQLAHAGRKSSTTAPWLRKEIGANADSQHGGWPDNVVGPSAVPFDGGSYSPKELSTADIRHIQQSFVDAAVRADKAGFDVIEIHGAHGYLLHEFLSPISNKRTDEYGGSFENRTRMMVETVRAVRKVWPEEKPLFVRLSVTDWVEPSDEIPTGGWTEEESIELSKLLSAEGVDLIDCSTSGSSPKQKIPLSPGYQVPFASSIKKNVPGLLSGAVGLITEAKQANDIVENDSADLVFLGRIMLRNTSFVLDAATQLGAFAQYPHQYERGRYKTTLTFV
ncbi:hypothetical protein EV175_002742 [Coemansia sp. RSA 1933]|nr:hypothetical protein EV175_002742 [Coemansia sp. RSA 1933]